MIQRYSRYVDWYDDSAPHHAMHGVRRRPNVCFWKLVGIRRSPSNPPGFQPTVDSVQRLGTEEREGLGVGGAGRNRSLFTTPAAAKDFLAFTGIQARGNSGQAIPRL